MPLVSAVVTGDGYQHATEKNQEQRDNKRQKRWINHQQQARKNEDNSGNHRVHLLQFNDLVVDVGAGFEIIKLGRGALLAVA